MAKMKKKKWEKQTLRRVYLTMWTTNQKHHMEAQVATQVPVDNAKKVVKEEDPAMKCEICEQWYHIKCQSITKLEYNYIQGGTKKKSVSKMHWYCQTCDRVAVNFMKTMTSLHIKHQKIEERMNNWKIKSIERWTRKISKG